MARIMACVVVILITIGGMVYFIYHSLDVASNIIFDYWRRGDYITSAFSLVVSALALTGLWYGLDMFAVDLSMWLFGEYDNNYANLIICLFVMFCLSVAKDVKREE